MEDIVQARIRENQEVQRVLRQREEELEDDINDTFAKITLILEERRKDVVSQLRSRVNGKFQKLGKICYFKSRGSVRLGSLNPCPSTYTFNVYRETNEVIRNSVWQVRRQKLSRIKEYGGSGDPTCFSLLEFA